VTRRLRALYVGPLPPARGGSEVVGMVLLRELRARGVAVCALAALPRALRGAAVSAEYRRLDGELGVTRYDVPTPSSMLEMGSSDPGYRAAEGGRIAAMLPGILRATRPDVVIIGRESLGWHVPDIALEHGIPTVAIVHGGQTLHGLLGGHEAFSAAALLAQLRKVDVVVAVAQHVSRALRELGLTRVSVIPNPVDTRLFTRRAPSAALTRALGIPPQSTVVLHLSNLGELKRPLDLVYAAELASRMDDRLLYIVVGDGPLRPALERRVAAAGAQRRFRFVGWIDHWRVPDYINLADVVVMPSEREGQSLVYLEAQACGKLIVASDIPAAREVITDGETGLLFERGQVADLARKLVVAAAHPALRAAIGIKAQAAVAVHASHRVAGAYAELLAGLAERRRGPDVPGAPASADIDGDALCRGGDAIPSSRE
jgi:glycosyltransferase involved in cell wall biosynthesis